MAVLHECGPACMIAQQQRRRKAAAPFALGLACVCFASSAVARWLNPGLMTIVQTHFPGAEYSYMILPKVLKALNPYGLRPRFVMYDTSICPDEIKEETALSTLLANHYGKIFPLGGPGGVPFLGKTGFMTFSHHVPTDGHIVVMFGPHLELSLDGEPGKFTCLGQVDVSSACGAATAACAQLTFGQTMMVNDANAQQCWLCEKFATEIENIKKATNPAVYLYFNLYKIIEKEIFTIVNTNYGPGKLVLLGGITINMPHPTPAYFLPLHFSIRSEGHVPVDLMSSFGMPAANFTV